MTHHELLLAVDTEAKDIMEGPYGCCSDEYAMCSCGEDIPLELWPEFTRRLMLSLAKNGCLVREDSIPAEIRHLSQIPKEALISPAEVPGEFYFRHIFSMPDEDKYKLLCRAARTCFKGKLLFDAERTLEKWINKLRAPFIIDQVIPQTWGLEIILKPRYNHTQIMKVAIVG